MGEIIREARKAKGLTQAELAAMLGVTQVAVSCWETGENIPSLQAVKALAEVLEISVEEIVKAV